MPTPVSRRAARALALVAVLAAALGATSPGCANLNSFLYNPRTTDAYTLQYAASVPAQHRVPDDRVTRLQRTADDGTEVFAVFLARPDAEMAAAPTVLYHHGNASNIDGYWARASRIWSLGANVLIYDYPGYGRTRGTPSEAGIYAAARAMLAYLTSLGAQIDQTRIFHYGYSLGGGPATELAASVPGTRGLVLEAPFTSVAGLVADGSLFVPRSFVMDNAFDNRAKIRRAAAAAPNGVLIFHGDADDFVQTAFGQQLDAEIARAPAAGPHQLVLVPGANHGDVPERAGVERYDAPLQAFLMQ